MKTFVSLESTRDAARLVPVALALAPALGEGVVRSIEAWCAGEDLPDGSVWEVYLATTATGRPLGLCGVYSMGVIGELWLGWLGVLPDQQGHGYGSCMVREMEFRAKALGASTLLVWCKPAIASFYGRLGFVPDDRPAPQPRCVVMRKAVRLP